VSAAHPVDTIRKALAMRAEGRTYSDIADIIGCHRSLICHWQKRHERDPQWPHDRHWPTLDVPQHNTAGYRAGCRCEACRGAMAAQQRAWEKRKYIHGHRQVPAAGTVRRIQALMALGWPHRLIADAAGVTVETVRNLNEADPRVFVESAEKIRRAYSALSMQVGPSRQVASVARNRGYVPPLAWDDDEIDDPDARPRDTGTGRGQWNTRLPDGPRLAALVNGASVKVVADKYGVEYRSVQKRLWRAGYRAVQIGAGEYRYVRRDAA
jgi:hypothetical protein